MYRIDYQYPVNATEAEANAIDELPATGTLEEAIEACRNAGVSAKLYDEQGFLVGWTFPNGDYRVHR